MRLREDKKNYGDVILLSRIKTEYFLWWKLSNKVSSNHLTIIINRKSFVLNIPVYTLIYNI